LFIKNNVDKESEISYRHAGRPTTTSDLIAGSMLIRGTCAISEMTNKGAT
jgi:hypothetical protein